MTRPSCVDDMLLCIQEEASKLEDGKGVGVARFVFLATFNLLGKLMLSKDLLDSKSNEWSEFFSAMMRLMQWNGNANLADFFPWLRWLDLQGLRRNMEKDLGKAIEIASGLVMGRMNNIIEDHHLGSDEKRKDFLSVLLGFQGNGKDEPDKISDRDINIFILVSSF